MLRVSDTHRPLLEAFGRAWEQGDVEALVAVFTPDALFLESPFGTPAKGAAAIRAYWRDLPANQAEVTFRTGEIYVAGPWFATEFRCSYRRRRTGERVEIKGAMFCETQDDKIGEMRMYWHRND